MTEKSPPKNRMIPNGLLCGSHDAFSSLAGRVVQVACDAGRWAYR
jgi:hypothetical protein